MTLLLESVCDPARHSLKVPFRVDDWVVGSDAYLLLAERRADRAPAPDWATGIVRLFEDGERSEWVGARAAELRQICGRPLLPVVCPDCSGEGLGSIVDLADCSLCDGTGCVIERINVHDLDWSSVTIVFDGLVFDRRLLASALVHVESEVVELRNLKSVGALQLRWDQGERRAAVMSLSGKPEPWMEYLL